MSGVVRLVGADTVQINGRLFTDFPHGEIGKLSYSTDIMTVKTGKNQNAIFAVNESGNQATLELRILRGSEDDKWMNQQHVLQKSDPTHFVLANGEIVKAIGDGQGTVTNDTYVLTGGAFTKNIDVVSNVEGEVEQAVAKYTMQFAIAPRAIA
jgi:hypothetical protein